MTRGDLCRFEVGAGTDPVNHRRSRSLPNRGARPRQLTSIRRRSSRRARAGPAVTRALGRPGSLPNRARSLQLGSIPQRSSRRTRSSRTRAGGATPPPSAARRRRAGCARARIFVSGVSACLPFDGGSESQRSLPDRDGHRPGSLPNRARSLQLDSIPQRSSRRAQSSRTRAGGAAPPPSAANGLCRFEAVTGRNLCGIEHALSAARLDLAEIAAGRAEAENRAGPSPARRSLVG